MEINLIKSNFEIDYARPLNPHFMSIKGLFFLVIWNLLMTKIVNLRTKSIGIEEVCFVAANSDNDI